MTFLTAKPEVSHHKSQRQLSRCAGTLDASLQLPVTGLSQPGKQLFKVSHGFMDNPSASFVCSTYTWFGPRKTKASILCIRRAQRDVCTQASLGHGNMIQEGNESKERSQNLISWLKSLETLLSLLSFMRYLSAFVSVPALVLGHLTRGLGRNR